MVSVGKKKLQQNGVSQCMRELLYSAHYFKVMCGLDPQEEWIHRELHPSAISKSEEDVTKITTVILDRFGNPFSLNNQEKDEAEPLYPT